MIDFKDSIQVKGRIVRRVTYKDGRTPFCDSFSNAVLTFARIGSVQSLVNGEPFYITEMLFGDGGTVGNSPRPVNPLQDGLHGVTRANKKVVGQIDPEVPTQAIFTATLGYEDANGFNINEMGLMTNLGKLYCMSTFPDMTKTENMQVDWDWYIIFV